MIVNVIGAFILGTFIVLSQQWNLDGRYSLFAAIGFCGSLTTMSGLALESSNLLENNHYGTFAIVQGNHWSQSVGEKGILYKSLKDPFSKLIVQSSNGSKKLYRVPKDRTVIVTNDTVHFLGELA